METVDIQNPLDSFGKKEKEQISVSLGTVLTAFCFVVLVAVPLIFVPFLADPLDLPKQLLIFFIGVAGLLIWSLKNLLRGKFTFARSTFDLPMALLAICAIVSAVLTPNLYASLSAETVLIVGGVALFFLFSGVPDKETVLGKIGLVLSISGAILGFTLIIQRLFALLPANSSMLNNPSLFFLNPGFNLAGSALAAGLFLASLLPLAIGLWKSNELKQKEFLIPLIILIAAGLVCAGVTLYQNRPILLDQLSGWKIATGVIGSSPKNALLGVGPGNVVDAFAIFKPADFNNSDFWNLRFSTSSNFYLTILTTFGIIGLAILAIYLVKLGKIAKSRLSLESTGNYEKGLLGSIILILVLGLFLPTPLLSLFLFFVLSGTLMALYRLKGVSLYSKTEDDNKAKYISLAVTVLSLVLLIGGAYFLGRFALADYYFAKSLQAAAKNNGKDTYELQIKALELNPYNSNYRISYSQTNLALANSLAGQPNLTDEQKQTVVTLVQQAIREARIAAALAPQRAGAYENLSLVYRNLINFAQGADQWAVQSQNAAVQMDPTNPRLRLDLGGIFFAAKDYQTAAQVFNQAASLKPDYANAHYNLAQALKGLGQNDLALQELQTTSTLVCVATANKVDCERVNSEIDELNKTIKAAGTNTPEATPSAQVSPSPTEEQQPLASPGAQNSNLPKTAITPTPKVGSSSGELQP